ncbi:hypothetical protein [Roseobacter sp. A03A-229]
MAFILLTGEDPDRINPISAESEPIVPTILPMNQGVTLALFKDAEGRDTPLLVTGISDAEIFAVDLAEQGAGYTADLLHVASDLGQRRLARLFAEAKNSGAGLMSGDVGEAGRAIGHSEGGPFSVHAVYHFPDRPDSLTVACFTTGRYEGVPEFAAIKIAQQV